MLSAYFRPIDIGFVVFFGDLRRNLFVEVGNGVKIAFYYSCILNVNILQLNKKVEMEIDRRGLSWLRKINEYTYHLLI